MIRFLKKIKIPENPEILLMLISGILLQMIDGSPFSIKYRWRLIWDVELPSEYFSTIAQKVIKTILVIIIIVRCSTTYAYVVFAILVIFCLLKRSTPKLMLPWLMVAGIKSICMTFVEAIAGVYVCSAFGKIRRACIEFFISKAIEIILAAYLWGNVLSIYQDLESKGKNEVNFPTKDDSLSNTTRQRARSLLDETTLYKTACLNNFEFKDVPQIILQMLRRDDEMSKDSLLGPGMMLASVSNLGSFDSLKTSQSLGELGFMDLGTTQVVGLEEDENLSYRDKVMRFLKLTRSDIAKIKLNKSTVEKDIYTVGDEIWDRVMTARTRVNKPKQTRTEIFIREIPQPEESIHKIENQRKGTLKFDITFSDLLLEKQGELQDDQEEEDSVIFSQDEEEGKEDEATFRLFMSNIKEGVLIRRLGLGLGMKVRKGNRYEKLYTQDFMNTIGPEVFDKAPNLPKVTSFTKIMRHSVSLPDMLQTNRKKNSSPEDSKEKMDENSSSDFYAKNSKLFKKRIISEESFSEEEIGNIVEKLPAVNEIPSNTPVQEVKFKKVENEDIKQSSTKKTEDQVTTETNREEKIVCPSNNINITESDTVKEPCLRRRKILIKRTRGKIIPSQKITFDRQRSPRNSNGNSERPTDSQIKYDEENCRKSNMTLENNSSNSSTSTGNISPSFKNNQMHFITEILRKPLWELSITYIDSDNLTKSQGTSGVRFQKILRSVEAEPREEKTWKSDVLKTTEMCFMPKYPKNIEPLISNKSNNIYAEYLKILKKRKMLFEKEKFPLGSSDINYESFTPTVRHSDSDTENVDKSSQMSDSFSSIKTANEDLDESLNFLGVNSPPKVSTLQERSVEVISSNDSLSSGEVLTKTDTSHNKKTPNEMTVDAKLDVVKPSEDPAKEDDSFSSQDSDEPISLFYSKAADLASPLLDMKRFIYPDHIHYSYKHVNKKGFDVDINGGFPLLVGENLPISTPLNILNGSRSRNREPEIKRRPMDLSFASTNAFADWQNNYSNDPDTKRSPTIGNITKKEQRSSDIDFTKCIKPKKMKCLKKINEKKESKVSNGITKAKLKSKPFGKNINDITFMYYAKDYALIEKLLRMHMQFNKFEFLETKSGKSEKAPSQISSTQLHSNKGRKNSIRTPVIFPRKTKNRNDKKKIDSQEERTKDMIARLASEAFLQNTNVFKSSSSKRHI